MKVSAEMSPPAPIKYKQCPSATAIAATTAAAVLLPPSSFRHPVRTCTPVSSPRAAAVRCPLTPSSRTRHSDNVRYASSLQTLEPVTSIRRSDGDNTLCTAFRTVQSAYCDNVMFDKGDDVGSLKLKL